MLQNESCEFFVTSYFDNTGVITINKCKLSKFNNLHIKLTLFDDVKEPTSWEGLTSFDKISKQYCRASQYRRARLPTVNASILK